MQAEMCLLSGDKPGIGVSAEIHDRGQKGGSRSINRLKGTKLFAGVFGVPCAQCAKLRDSGRLLQHVDVHTEHGTVGTALGLHSDARRRRPVLMRDALCQVVNSTQSNQTAAERPKK